MVPWPDLVCHLSVQCFTRTQPHPFVSLFSVAAYAAQRQRGVCETETLRPTESRMSTVTLCRKSAERGLSQPLGHLEGKADPFSYTGHEPQCREWGPRREEQESWIFSIVREVLGSHWGSNMLISQ